MVNGTADWITVLTGLEGVRRRPELYIGGPDEHASRRVRLLELAVIDIVWKCRPQQVRILLWREDAVTIAYNGSPLPIEPCALGQDIPYPALYRSFMYLPVPSTNGMAVLNALSELLVVSTMHNGHRYRGVFSRGMIVSLLDRSDCFRPLAATWLTYRPDATIFAGQALTPDDLHGIAERARIISHKLAEHYGVNTESVPITIEDRMTEDADWD